MIFLLIANLAELSFLARHQDADGSWGRTPATCTCPRRIPKRPARVDAQRHAEAVAWIERFQSRAIEEREEAQAELEKLGQDAVPALLDAAGQSPDAETRARCEDTLLRIGDPGASDAGTTALALLAFLGVGYSHLSKETVASRDGGEIVGNAAQYLLRGLTKEGVLSASPVDNAWAALALIELYGHTESKRIESSAALARRYHEQNLSSNPRVRFWQAVVLHRAVKAGFPSSKPVAFDGDDLWSLIGAAYTTGDERKLRMLLALDVDVLDPEEQLAIMVAASRRYGPRSPTWKAWSPAIRQKLVLERRIGRPECARGSWDALPKTTALHTLTLEVYYRYGCSLGE